MQVEGENDKIKYRPPKRQVSYLMIKEYIKETLSADIHTQNIAMPKSLCGLEKRSNYVKDKSLTTESDKTYKNASNHFSLIYEKNRIKYKKMNIQL